MASKLLNFVYDKFETPMTEAIAYAYGNRKDLLSDEYVVEQKELAIKGIMPRIAAAAVSMMGRKRKIAESTTAS